MKTVRLSLVAALAALGLQACDINVKPDTQVTAPQSSLPDDTVLNAPATPTAAVPDAQQPAAPVDSTPTPVQSTEAPVAPETNAMGAQPGAAAVAAPDGVAVAAPDGVAAPTELAQFLEQNAIKSTTP